MKRRYATFEVKDIALLKQQMLNWSAQFNICCLLDNNNYSSPGHSYEYIVGAGSISTFCRANTRFNSLASFLAINNDWIFGHFDYDLKNEIEPGLKSQHPDHTDFPEATLFVPDVVAYLQREQLVIGSVSQSPDYYYHAILQTTTPSKHSDPIYFSSRISKAHYINKVDKLKEHIHKGDCYEINFCQEFFGSGLLKPTTVFAQLMQISPNPFSAFYKIKDHYILCASPERYLKKEGNILIAQPIKGTAPRHLDDKVLDQKSKAALENSLKERTENVMIVDLVRNDLSKICTEGSVAVKELFEVYEFPAVFQMISTVEGELPETANLADVVQATFPMGSMTGAPKKKVMELIEQYEETKRGIYSGSIGYVTPAKDFDFNVVIRSLVYNSQTNYISYHVGSAITAASIAEQEYEECLLKGQALNKVLNANISPL